MNAIQGIPVTDKYLSVVGEVAEPIVLKAPLGTSLRACVAAAAPKISEYALIVGGPMMGKPLTGEAEIDAAVVTKTTGNLIVLPKDHYLFRRAAMPIEKIRQQTKSACIQCRMCTDLCPRRLLGHQIRPNLMMRNLWREDQITDNEEYLRTFGDAANCCDCGVCEMFACPMGLSPRKVNSYLKGQLRDRGIQVPKNQDPQASSFIDDRRTPTDRLVMTGKVKNEVRRQRILVLCADNGVVAEGVSSAPRSVTAAQAVNMTRGLTGMSSIAKAFGCELVVADVGIACDYRCPQIRDLRIARGTRNLAVEPAMTRDETLRAILAGAGLAQEAAQDGVDIIGVGEMGIGNTTTSSAVLAALTGADAAAVTGRGGGITDESFARKKQIIDGALALHRPDAADAVDVLSKVGGLDLAAMARWFPRQGAGRYDWQPANGTGYWLDFNGDGRPLRYGKIPENNRMI